MSRNWFARRFAPALFVLAALTSCSDTSPSAPTLTEPQHLLFWSSDGESTTAKASSGEYTFIRERSPFDLGGTTISAIIGVAGGTLTLGGHQLIVPRGAVTVPTLFTISLPLDPYVNVDLLATVQTLFGIVNIGERGFKVPVMLGLTYSRATNVTDPSRLIVVHVPNRGPVEPLPSEVNQETRTVWARLPHFSKYCMATN
ncbi:MAG TPA: hypothetical protein VGD27_18110 [Longimicrobiales bacterium]